MNEMAPPRGTPRPASCARPRAAPARLVALCALSARLGRRALPSRLGPSIALGLAAASLAAPAAAQTKPRGKAPKAPAARPLGETLEGDAKASYEAGRVLFGVGNFEGALIKFQRAHELSGDPRLLWNMAACEKGLRHYAKLLALLEAYRSSPSPLIDERDRDEALKIVEVARAFVSALKVEVSEPGARVFVDGVEVGASPLAEPVPVDIGQREVRVTKAGFREYRKAQVVPGADSITLQVRLEPERHQGRLVLDAGPRDAIEVDGRAAGVGHWEGVLPSGAHHVRVTAPGMRPYDTDVVLGDDETRRLRAALEPERSGSGLGPWPWVVGGVLAAGGLALGGYLLFKPEDKYAPPAVGNLPPGTVYLP
ncbi:MAG TPA: PEGA domain-containing protein [Polyangiaceae bacterium]|nr:PEGA domain-containing protein [Polyangiaceae bacterium]